MQVQLTADQAETLMVLLGDNLDSQLLLTKQGTSVYAAFEKASYDIAADGTWVEVTD